MVGLILEGGGTRGIYTAGVLDCFMDNGIIVDKCYGVSAGAINGASYVSNQKGRSLVFWRDWVSNKKYGNLKNLMKTGMYFIKTDEIDFEDLDKEAFSSSSMELEIGLTDVNTGECEYIEIDDADEVDDLVTASAALPMFSRFNLINGKHYLDGGITDSIPCKRAFDDGMDKVICVLTQHKGFVKKKTKSYSIVRIKYRRYPKLVKAIKNRHIMYNEQLDYVYSLKKDKCLIIQPKKRVEVKRLEKNKAKLEELYNQGYNDAKEKIEEIKKFLKK